MGSAFRFITYFWYFSVFQHGKARLILFPVPSQHLIISASINYEALSNPKKEGLSKIRRREQKTNPTGIGENDCTNLKQIE